MTNPMRQTNDLLVWNNWLLAFAVASQIVVAIVAVRMESRAIRAEKAIEKQTKEIEKMFRPELESLRPKQKK